MDSERRLFFLECIGIVALLKSGSVLSEAEISNEITRLPDIEDLQKTPSFDAFYALSLILTSQKVLNQEFAEKVYEVFMQEPWSSKHINTVIRVIKKSTSKHTRSFNIHDAMNSNLFADSETWFISHLLYTWFTGIYYYTGRDQRLSYSHALINTVLDGLYVTPTLSHYQPGFWSEIPGSKS